LVNEVPASFRLDYIWRATRRKKITISLRLNDWSKLVLGLRERVDRRRREIWMHALLNPANIVEWLATGHLGIFVACSSATSDSVPEETVMLGRFSRRPRDPRPKYVYLVA